MSTSVGMETARQRDVNARGARMRSLDVLRTVAVLLVLGRHYDLFDAYRRIGWTGVDLFFVLSGFLISGLLFTDFRKAGRIHMGRFLIRRGFKIYPPFYALIAATALVYSIDRGHLREGRLLSELFFLQSYLPSMWWHTWSLAVEEHFYVLLPILLILLARLSRNREDPFRALPWMLLAVATAGLALRLWVCRAGPRPIEIIYYPSHMNVDSLLSGVVLSYFCYFRPAVFTSLMSIPRWVLLLVGLCLITPCLFLDLATSVFIQTVGHPMLFLGYGALLILALRWGSNTLPARGPAGNSLAFIGRHSYSIYLWHVPVSWGIVLLSQRRWLPANGVVQFLIYAGGSLVLGILMARLIEVPALMMRDRLFPSASGPLAAPVDRQRSEFPISATVPEVG